MLILFFFCNILKNETRGDLTMAFQLKTNKKETENKTIRFPVSLIEKIEETIKEQDISFSSFVIQACEYALENLDEK